MLQAPPPPPTLRLLRVGLQCHPLLRRILPAHLRENTDAGQPVRSDGGELGSVSLLRVFSLVVC